MCPRSNPLFAKSNDCTRYQSGGTRGSGRNVSKRSSVPTQSSDRCQLTQFGRPRSRLYDSAYSAFCIRKFEGLPGSGVAPVGLPIVRCSVAGYGGGVPVETVKENT